MKVLILSCSTGAGHDACARYILEELKYNNIESVFKNFYDIVDVKAKDFVSKAYLSTLGGNGEVFKNIYKLGELYSKTKLRSPVYLVNKLHRRTLYNYIVDNEFDVVVATHLFPALTLTAINKYDFPKKINFITVSTDYEPCPFMEETQPNYLVMQKGLEERFIQKGIPKDILVNIGITISTRFFKEAKDVRADYNIKYEKVILIMLGSMGFGKITEILDDLLNIDNCKVIVVCGTNQKLYNELKAKNNDSLISLGFAKNINDLIYSSDIVLSKPGGLFTTEIACLGKPLLHVFPIPGIETYNSIFFEEHGMGLKCDSNEEILENVHKLLNDSELRKSMVENQRKLMNRNSASDLVKLIKSMDK